MSKKTYFFSDIHLGLPDFKRSLTREKLLVKCLNEIKNDAKAVYFVGDIFDFWWEYKHVVPRGYTRFFGKIAEFTDSGIEVHFFTGNHDLWMNSYLPEELGIILHKTEFETEIGDKKFYITHGDGLGHGDRKYKLLKTVFTNRTLQWLFSRLHPNFAFGLARFWSHTRRKSEREYKFAGRKSEFLLQHADGVLTKKDIDIFIFGHRHIPYIFPMNEKTVCANIGEWLLNFTFLVFDGKEISQKTYKSGVIEDFTADLEKTHRLNVFGC